MKKFLFLFLLIANTAWGMDTPLFHHSSNTPSNSATSYAPVYATTGSPGWTTTAANELTLQANKLPLGGTIKGLQVKFLSPITQGSYTITVRKNAVDTAVTCAVTDQECTDLISTVSVSLDDKIAYKLVPSGSPVASAVLITVLFDSGNTGKSLFVFNQNGTVNGSANRFSGVMASGSINSTEANVSQRVTSAGTLSGLGCYSNAAPGAGTSYAVTVMLNGVATNLEATLSDTGTACTPDTSDSVAIAVNDLISYRYAPSNTPAAIQIKPSMVFTPTIDGESMVMFANPTSPSTTVANYAYTTGLAAFTATEADTQVLTPAAVFKNLYVSGTTAPGAAKSYTYALRLDGASQLLTTSISGAAQTSNSETGINVNSSVGDLMNMLLTPAGTPTAPGVNRHSMTIYISPGSVINNAIIR